MADAAEPHINQVRRYEAGSAQPTLEGLIKLVQALVVVHAYRNSKADTVRIRIISARSATKHEIKQYKQG